MKNANLKLSKKEEEKKQRKALKWRYTAFVMAFIVMFSTLLYRLADLQIVNGADYLYQSETNKMHPIKIEAPRGKILDRNMQVMAANERQYVVEMYRHNLIDEAINDVLIKTLAILEKNGDGFIDNLPIVLTDKGFAFNWDTDDAEKAKAKEVKFKNDNNIEASASAEEAFKALREKYKIPEDMDVQQARKIVAIRYEMSQSGYKRYIPTPIAINVSQKTVFEIEERSVELPGVNISTQYVRQYPMGQTAAHVVGYLGKISEEEKDKYEAKGYDISKALVGKSGIEKSMEDQLTGSSGDRLGERWVMTDVVGRLIKELPDKARDPKSGNNVVLNIDAELQKVAEQSLKNTIDAIRNGKYNKPGPYADDGAAVVMNVNTGEVLAMVSYPSYDPNGMVGNNAAKYFRQLISDESNPLLNRVITGAYTPGSTFKIATAVAALQEGVVTPNTIIVDKGLYTLNGTLDPKDAPACWYWNDYGRTHGSENVRDAIKDSCNYYFFEVTNRMGIDNLYKWADRLGLTRPTGIDLPGEISSFVDNPGRREAATRTFITNNIKKALNVEEMNAEWEQRINATVDKLLKVKYYDKTSVRAILDEDLHLGDDNTLVDTLTSPQGTWATQQWSIIDHIITGIGQAQTMLTPIAMVRYISAVVNGGKVLTPHVVKQVVDNNGTVIETIQPEVQDDLKLDPAYVEAIKAGMHSVTEEGGTASSFFGQFLKQYPSMSVGGKTGTAQTSSDPKKSNAVFVAFAPYEKPEIAIAIVVPGGRSGSYLSPVAIDILKTYFKLDQTEEAKP
ncbi:MAG: penicillin-binding protein 2 [Clostridiales bacterium]|nr:penicillin-binding protein 2 [Clostridiales bacterium]MDK2991966.1 penicillin-binding protein 2 [Clostridiales bacterium]